jgi:general secretion pathway protein J
MHNKIRGFTLLEILIALFIFTIVSIIMTSALYSLLNSQSITEKKSQRMTALETSLLLLSNDLEQTINRSILSSKDTFDFFIGTHNYVIFTHGGLANPLNMLQRSTLQRTEYLLDDKHHFVRLTWPVLDQTRKTEANPRILLDDVKDVHFEYLDKQGHFHDRWTMKNATDPLPKAVRVTLMITHWGAITQLYLISAQVSPKMILSSKGGAT